ncbi:MAG: ester cyclase [Dehalococcoidia bacterium]
MDSMELMRVWTDEVWNAGNYDRVADCLGETYLRHDQLGNRAVTRDQATAQIQGLRDRVQDLHFWVDDFTVAPNRIWVRWRMTGTSAESGEPVIRSGLQVYRVTDGRLAETWAAGAPDGDDWTAPLIP